MYDLDLPCNENVDKVDINFFCLISIAPSGDVPSRGPVMKIRGDHINDARLCKVNRSKNYARKKNHIII